MVRDIGKYQGCNFGCNFGRAVISPRELHPLRYNVRA
jgi:hypothetical protein